ncbi:MAG: hypothetical protein HXY19_06340 [Thermoanaerobaculaceae bacterium]|nr:hypothetical protein [Thermoanaerobaculaceae bacterium]
MPANLVPRPLLSWDGFSVRCDLDLLERLAERELPRRVEQLQGVRIAGAGPTLVITLRLAWQGLPAQLVVTATDLRVYRRFLGCRIESLRGPLGVPVPLSMAAALLRRFAQDRVRLDPKDGVLLVDLRPYLPEGVHVGVAAATVTGRVLELELAPGSLAPPA